MKENIVVFFHVCLVKGIEKWENKKNVYDFFLFGLEEEKSC